jgi:two-component system, chemotaxis family, protein-glutamate methylesterase/glutaminase
LETPPMIGHNIVAIGTSAGGVAALNKLVADLPTDLPAAVFIVMHLPEEAPSMLPRILNRAGPLEAVSPEDGESVERGRVYVAPPNLHLLLENGTIRLRRGPKENRQRPAVDPLFRTAALAYGPRVVGVVLTGALDDGTAGLRAIKSRGGVAVVQDPEEALVPGMPQSALQYVEVDHCLPVEEIALLLSRLAREPATGKGAHFVPEDMEFESKIAGLDPTVIDSGDHPGTLSAFSCPECAGPLYEIRDGELVRFRCRVGHAYTNESVLEEKSEVLENALYLALNTLEESATLSERMAARLHAGGNNHAVARFEERAREAKRRAAEIRRILTEM